MIKTTVVATSFKVLFELDVAIVRDLVPVLGAVTNHTWTKAQVTTCHAVAIELQEALKKIETIGTHHV